MSDYGKIGNNRVVKFAAKRENASGSYLSSSSVRDCRLSSGTKTTVRVKSAVGVTGGSNTGAISSGKPVRNRKKVLKRGKWVKNTRK